MSDQTTNQELRVIHALVILLDAGAGARPVPWAKVSLRIPGGFNTVVLLERRNLVRPLNGGENPGIMFTVTGYAVARFARIGRTVRL